ncbi:hypothetical protein ACFLQ6_07845 [Thermoproteota archaeon]
MSRIKSLLTSTITTVISALGFIMPVIGYDEMQDPPVGGVVTAANKLTIIAPYLVLAGLVAVASAIYIKRRRH